MNSLLIDFCLLLLLLLHLPYSSNMLCVFVIWIFMVLCQVIIIPRCTMAIICLAVGTVVLTFCCVLVMAEEFPGN